MFPAQAVREIKQNYKDNKHANIVIFKDKFTALQLSIIKRDARKWNKDLYFKQINSVNDLIAYINNGDTTVDRSKLKISTIKIFSHGLPSILDFGLMVKMRLLKDLKLNMLVSLRKNHLVVVLLFILLRVGLEIVIIEWLLLEKDINMIQKQ